MASDDFDRRDDEPDDRDRWDDRDDDRPRGDRSAARARVSTPGLLLIIFGVLGILSEVATLGVSLSNPWMMRDVLKGMIESQPPGPAKEQALKDFKAEEESYRLDTPMNIGSTVFGLILSGLMVVGGAKMRSVSGYGLAVTGAVCGIIPINGCCCLAMPFGIWAVVVLADPAVKAAFRSAAWRPRE
jgi:hypothetical protein